MRAERGISRERVFEVGRFGYFERDLEISRFREERESEVDRKERVREFSRWGDLEILRGIWRFRGFEGEREGVRG